MVVCDVATGWVRGFVGLALVLACGEKAVPAPPPLTEDVEPVTPEAAPAPIVQPTQELAAAVLSDFVERLLSEPQGDLTMLLRIPTGIRPQQLSFYYEELRTKYINRAGVEAVMVKEFGLVVDRLGESAQGVADQMDLPVLELWAFGDLESAAILHWDGERFWVASVHQLFGADVSADVVVE